MIKTVKTEENTVKQGRNNANVFWVNMKAYQMIEDSVLLFAGGGSEKQEDTELVLSFIKRNKKSYTKYATEEVKEYNEIVNFGKHKGFSVQHIFDNEKSWLKWCLSNYTFKIGEEKLKKEIIEILK